MSQKNKQKNNKQTQQTGKTALQIAESLVSQQGMSEVVKSLTKFKQSRGGSKKKKTKE